MPRPLLPPRGIFIPVSLIYDRDLPPAVRDTWIQLRGLAWGRQETPSLALIQLSDILEKKSFTLYEHMRVLQARGALRWRPGNTSEIIVVFPEDEECLLSGIPDKPDPLNPDNLNLNDSGVKDSPIRNSGKPDSDRKRRETIPAAVLRPFVKQSSFRHFAWPAKCERLLVWILLFAAVRLGLGRVLQNPGWGFLRAACDGEQSACAVHQVHALALAATPAALPALFELLFGEQAGCAYAAAGEQMQAWAEAFEAWLAEMGKRQAHKKLQQKRASWRRFLKFLQGPPWKASGADVTRWGQALTAEGLRPQTVNSYLCTLSSFYRFCGSRSPELFPQGKATNPAREAHRPAVRQYERASCLSADEVQALLGAVDRESSVVGKRDYALLLTCLETGWSIGKVRQLRWGDQQGIEDQDAVQEYLRAAGRWEGMQAGEYVFAPFVDPLNRKPSGRREDWNVNKPLSVDLTQFLLKRYAGWAGLDVTKVNYQCLRHTAMLLHAQAGKEAESIQAFGGRTSLRNTRLYVKRMRQAADLAAKRGKPVERGPYQRKWGKLQPGSQLNLRHGMYARQTPGQETEENTETQPQGTRKRAVARLRRVIRRIYELGEQAQTVKELTTLLEVMGTAVERLWRLSKGARKQGEEKDGSDARAHEFVRRLEEGQKESHADGEESWPESEETIIILKKWLFQVEQETSIKEEVRMLDEMIERGEKTGREYSRLDEALGLLNAVSQAEMRRERCGGTQGKEDMSADDKLHDLIQQAARQVTEQLRKPVK